MYITYAFSLKGKAHDKSGKPCQDYSKVEQIDDNIIVAITADGVGSAARAEVGSYEAVEAIMEFLQQNTTDMASGGLLYTLKEAYTYALSRIRKRVQEEQGLEKDYDTTLDVGILKDNVLYYGHVGDGGIIVRNFSGKFEAVTSAQKGADGNSVIPLRFEEHWVFGKKKDVSAVLLMTDGIWDICNPYLLRFADEGVYKNIIRIFSDYNCYRRCENAELLMQDTARLFLQNKLTQKGYRKLLLEALPDNLKKEKNAIAKSIGKRCYPLELMKYVQDDKTVAVIVNTDIDVFEMPQNYYMEEKWGEYQETWNRLAYPGLYADENVEKITNSN